MHGRVQNVEHLLSYGASVDSPDGEGQSILQAAAVGGKTAIAKMLLDAGAEVNHIQESKESTALHLATCTYDIELVELLLRRGADPNLFYREGSAPLVNAVHRGDEKMTKLLLKYGADLFVFARRAGTETETETVLHLAVRRRHALVVRLMVQAGCPVWVRDSQGRTPLELADCDDVVAALYVSHSALWGR